MQQKCESGVEHLEAGCLSRTPNQQGGEARVERLRILGQLCSPDSSLQQELPVASSFLPGLLTGGESSARRPRLRWPMDLCRGYRAEVPVGFWEAHGAPPLAPQECWSPGVCQTSRATAAWDTECNSRSEGVAGGGRQATRLSQAQGSIINEG